MSFLGARGHVIAEGLVRAKHNYLLSCFLFFVVCYNATISRSSDLMSKLFWQFPPLSRLVTPEIKTQEKQKQTKHQDEKRQPNTTDRNRQRTYTLINNKLIKGLMESCVNGLQVSPILQKLCASRTNALSHTKPKIW